MFSVELRSLVSTGFAPPCPPPVSDPADPLSPLQIPLTRADSLHLNPIQPHLHDLYSASPIFFLLPSSRSFQLAVELQPCAAACFTVTEFSTQANYIIRMFDLVHFSSSYIIISDLAV